MKYRIYLYSYEFGWELYTIVTKEESILETINNVSPYDYGQYIIVKQLEDRDEVYDCGIIASAIKNKKSKKLSKKNNAQ